MYGRLTPFGGGSGSSTASDVAVEGTYSNIPGTPTDLESTISSINTALGNENLWDRAATTLSPHTANDSVNVGTGSITSGHRLVTTHNTYDIGTNAARVKDAYLQGNLVVAGNVDGRDVSTDGAALDAHLNGGANKHDASEIDVEGTYVNIAGTPTDLETTVSAINSSLGTLSASIALENTWDRSGSTLSPHTANDNIDTGTGSQTGGNRLSTTHNTYDIGTNANRFKDAYFQGNIVIAGTVDGVDVSTLSAAPASMTSATSLTAFIDNDNNSTTEAYSLYKNVTTPGTETALFRVQENRRAAINDNTPFATTASGGTLTDSASHLYQGIQVDVFDSGGNEALHSVIFQNSDSATQTTEDCLHYFCTPNGVQRINSNGAIFAIQNMSTNLTTVNSNFFYHHAANAITYLGINFSTSASAGWGTSFFKDTVATYNHLIAFQADLSGTPTHIGGIRVKTNGSDFTENQVNIDVINRDNAGTDIGVVIKPGDVAGAIRVGINTTTPGYLFDINRSAANTNRVRMAGVTGTTGYTLQAYRNLTSTSTDSPVVFIHQDHASDDQAALSIQQDGSGNLIDSANFSVSAAGAITLASTVDGVDVSAHDHSSSSGQTRLAAKDRRRMVHGEKHAADGAAADTLAEHMLFQAQDAVTVTKVFYLPDAALTADDTNNAVLLVSRRDSAGATKVTIATLTTNVASGNWTAFDGKDLGTITNSAIAAGAVITWEISKGGTGVVVPAGCLQVEVTVD